MVEKPPTISDMLLQMLTNKIKPQFSFSFSVNLGLLLSPNFHSSIFVAAVPNLQRRFFFGVLILFVSICSSRFEMVGGFSTIYTAPGEVKFIAAAWF